LKLIFTFTFKKSAPTADPVNSVVSTELTTQIAVKTADQAQTVAQMEDQVHTAAQTVPLTQIVAITEERDLSVAQTELTTQTVNSQLHHQPVSSAKFEVDFQKNLVKLSIKLTFSIIFNL
jgi:hypothetical protein